MASSSINERLRTLPSVEELLESSELKALEDLLPRPLIADIARTTLNDIRAAVRSTNGSNTIPTNIPQLVCKQAATLLNPSLCRVINASGVVLHTNLGRSVLADEAIEAVVKTARAYSTLEYDVEGMQRGSRHAHCEQLLCTLTGAEAAIAVNNNAAAVMLVLSELSTQHEVIVSRGELVEIGGSFRIPDIMKLSGARMVEVGTTNKTHPADYEHAITDDTVMLLKVHTSNYRLLGFTESVDTNELRRIADVAEHQRNERSAQTSNHNGSCMQASAGHSKNHINKHHIIVYEDLGSGALIHPDHIRAQDEPTVAEVLASGCDIVSFSGDKLLGGPQAGIIVGTAELIDRLKANPLARALRLDKMTLAALEATLRLYLNPHKAYTALPTLRMLIASADEMHTKAKQLARCIKSTIPLGSATVDVIPEISRAGGGALPMHDIDTFVVRVTPMKGSAQDCEEFLMKQNTVPIIARIRQEALLFDPRTLLTNAEHKEIAHALAAYMESLAPVSTSHTSETNSARRMKSSAQSNLIQQTTPAVQTRSSRKRRT